VGKTTLLDTLGAGLLASFFRRSKTPAASISGMNYKFLRESCLFVYMTFFAFWKCIVRLIQ